MCAVESSGVLIAERNLSVAVCGFSELCKDFKTFGKRHTQIKLNIKYSDE